MIKVLQSEMVNKIMQDELYELEQEEEDSSYIMDSLNLLWNFTSIERDIDERFQRHMDMLEEYKDKEAVRLRALFRIILRLVDIIYLETLVWIERSLKLVIILKRWEDPKTRNDDKCSGKKWDLDEVDKKTIDLYMGEHTEDPGKTSEDDLSEVIPIKE